MQASINELQDKGRLAKAAAKKLAFTPAKIKNEAMLAIAQALLEKEDHILRNNEKDYKEAEASGMSAAMLDRLMLNSNRLKGISEDVKTVANLPDPVGEVIEERTLPNGLHLSKRRVPLGVIGAIYESRPNVTVDISVLCLKAGNAVVLRGGSEAVRSNAALVKVAQEASCAAGVPEGAGASPPNPVVPPIVLLGLLRHPLFEFPEQLLEIHHVQQGLFFLCELLPVDRVLQPFQYLL